MRYFSPYFWLSLTLFTINQFVERAGIVIPWVHSYLDDLMAPGIVLGFALAFQQQITFRQPSYRLSWGHTLFFVLWYSLLFEVIFPSYDARHHADLMDVLAYSIGGIFFMKWGNRPARSVLLPSSPIS